VAGAVLAGAALGSLAAVAAFFVGFQEALSWDETAVVFTAFSLVPVALLVAKGGHHGRAVALGMAGLWLALALLWLWAPGRDGCPPDGLDAGPGAEGGCPPF
jgi:hypothetical protein